jgi:type IV pilus assembly protein PilP
MITQNIFRLLLPCAFLMLNACSQDVSDLQEFIDQTKIKHVGSVEPTPQFEAYTNFIYSAGELRDPFETAFQMEGNDDLADKPTHNQRPREPLEHFPLDTLRMVGVLERGNQIWGLIKDPQNMVHRVQVGNHAGTNEGEIISVSEERIELLEVVADGMGNYVERNATLGVGEQ